MSHNRIAQFKGLPVGFAFTLTESAAKRMHTKDRTVYFQDTYYDGAWRVEVTSAHTGLRALTPRAFVAPIGYAVVIRGARYTITEGPFFTKQDAQDYIDSEVFAPAFTKEVPMDFSPSIVRTQSWQDTKR